MQKTWLKAFCAYIPAPLKNALWLPFQGNIQKDDDSDNRSTVEVTLRAAPQVSTLTSPPPTPSHERVCSHIVDQTNMAASLHELFSKPVKGILGTFSSK